MIKARLDGTKVHFAWALPFRSNGIGTILAFYNPATKDIVALIKPILLAKKYASRRNDSVGFLYCLWHELGHHLCEKAMRDYPSFMKKAMSTINRQIALDPTYHERSQGAAMFMALHTTNWAHEVIADGYASIYCNTQHPSMRGQMYIIGIAMAEALDRLYRGHWALKTARFLHKITKSTKRK